MHTSPKVSIIIPGGVWYVIVDQKKVWFCTFLTIIEIIIVLSFSYLLVNQLGNIGIVTAPIVGRIVTFILSIITLLLIRINFNQ
jgi:uncharacterized membrane protein